MVIIVTLSETMALKCRGVRGRTEVELALFFFFFYIRITLIMVVLFASWGGGVRSLQSIS